MAGSGAERAFPVLWSAIQQPCAVEISLPGEMALETDAEQKQPKRAGHLGTDGPASQEMVA
ncbi:MAG: hypothetical protein A2Z14_06115 [Chloroflexi bacterium RBG_16_48_8]|nr:MAG: hypothetical protein A2Z14_06115 [Chloroflexi bacterium RBG_16_48_8]